MINQRNLIQLIRMKYNQNKINNLNLKKIINIIIKILKNNENF